MGQTTTKQQHYLDPLEYLQPPGRRCCQWCSSDGLECDGNCSKSVPIFAGYNNPYTSEARIQQKKSRRQAATSLGKPTPPSSRKGHSRNTSNSSNVSTASHAKSVDWKTPFPSPFPSATTAEFDVSVPKSVHVPLEEQALCYFLANWVLLPRQGCTGGYMEYIIPLYSTCKPNSHLHYALSAVSLAAFGNRPSCRQNTPKSVSAKASLQYAKALEETNRALRDPLVAKEDETLAAVLMLGFFETLTTYRAQTAWGSHNEGAVALVRLRGPENFKTRAGQMLFAAVRTQNMVKCLAQAKVFDKSVDWTDHHTFRSDGAYGMTQLNMLLIELRNDCDRIMTAHSRAHDPSNTHHVLELLARAEAAKEAYIDWTNTQTELWTFGPTALIEKLPPGTNIFQSEVFPGRVDIYHELWVASIWNMARVTGLLFSGIIVRCAAWLSPQTDFHTLPAYIEARRFDRKIIVDTIASVPFLLGWHKRQNRKDFLVPPEGTTAYSLSGFACGDDAPGTNAEHGKALGGYFSMWPMFIAASSDFCSEDESKWIHGRLRFISDHMGIHQANYFLTTKAGTRIPSMAIRRDRAELAKVFASTTIMPIIPVSSTNIPSSTKVSAPEKDFVGAQNVPGRAISTIERTAHIGPGVSSNVTNSMKLGGERPILPNSFQSTPHAEREKGREIPSHSSSPQACSTNRPENLYRRETGTPVVA